MSRFDTYFQMDVEDIIEYTLEKASMIPWDQESMQVEVPREHGNLNYVYKVWDGAGHKIFIKQAGTETRISKDMKPSTDRNRLESEILLLEEKYAPGMVPHIYFYDTVMCACGMEDCSDFLVMRNALMAFHTYPDFAEHITEFLVDTLLMTSDVVMDHRQKKELVGQFISPDLCDITEKLVFMEPYNDLNRRNNVFPPNQAFVEKELYGDKALHLAVAKLKFKFMTEAQSLIQGDLHTGSIFVKDRETKVFDSEFGTFAPMGYDIGNIIANMVFAYDYGMANGKKSFCDWVLKTIEGIVDLFIVKFNKKYQEAVTEPMAKVEGFQEWYLQEILKDSAGFAGTELHRRTVGMANVADVKGIADENLRIIAERTNILLGKELILHPEKFTRGAEYVRAIEGACVDAARSL